MKLTSEVKAYIAKRVEQLVPKSCLEDQLVALQEAGDEVAKELNAKILALKQETLNEFVEAHPEALGSDFSVNRYGNEYFIYSTLRSELQKELTQAMTLRREVVETTIAMAHIDASSCSNSAELDEAIIRLVNR
jgi:hypothetical protein